MTHDPLCSISQACAFDSRDGFHILYEARGGLIACDCCDRTCCCDVIAKVRADERAKYVLPDLPRGGEHVDWCRDLACYGCEEIADGVIAQDV